MTSSNMKKVLYKLVTDENILGLMTLDGLLVAYSEESPAIFNNSRNINKIANHFRQLLRTSRHIDNEELDINSLQDRFVTICPLDYE